MLQLVGAKEGSKGRREEECARRGREGEQRREGGENKDIVGESEIRKKEVETEEVKESSTPEGKIHVEELDENEERERRSEYTTKEITGEEKKEDRESCHEEERQEGKEETEENENDSNAGDEKVKKGDRVKIEGIAGTRERKEGRDELIEERAKEKGNEDLINIKCIYPLDVSDGEKSDKEDEKRGEWRDSVELREIQGIKVEREIQGIKVEREIQGIKVEREIQGIKVKREQSVTEEIELRIKGEESREKVEESSIKEEGSRYYKTKIRKEKNESRSEEGDPRIGEETDVDEPRTEKEKEANIKEDKQRIRVENRLRREERSARVEEQESKGEGEGVVRKTEKASKPRAREDELEAQEREETRRLWLTELDQEAVRGGQLRASRSTLDLPSSVSECFQDPSLLSSLQSRLLGLVGRGNRYHLRRSSFRPVMSLEALRRKVKEARLLLFPHQSSSSPPQTPNTPIFFCDQPPTLAINSGNLFRSVTHPGSKPSEGGKGFASLQKYWGGEGGSGGVSGEGGIGGEEEIELLQQYLSLQQLAISRKHSAQLRKIRDSLVSRRIRSRPSSVIGDHVQTFASPPKLLINAHLENESVLVLESNASDDQVPSPSNTSNLSSNPNQTPSNRLEPLNLTPVLENRCQGSPTQTPNHSRNHENQAKTSGFHLRRPTSLSQMQDPAYWAPASVQPSPTHDSNTPIHTFQPPLSHVQTPKSDRQQLRDFLLDVGFVQYYSLLNRHGYDLPTAAHMDALDLAGAGITEPLHRMALKFELELVKQPPKVPEEVPETIEEWLLSLNLEDYTENFHQNGLYCPLAAVGLNKRDLQLMGVYMQGHRKKILLALTGLSQALFGKE